MEVTLGQAAKKLRDMADRFSKEIAKAEKVNLNEARRMAITLSSGPYKTEQLKIMGHPYSRANPHPPRGRADIINVQDDVFRQSWLMVGPATSFATREIVTSLVNTTPYGYKMRGTPQMMPRPIDKTIATRMAPKRRARLDAATTRALSVR